MPDELDQLIESAVDFGADDEEPTAEEQAPDESNAIDESAADQDAEDVTPDESEDEPDSAQDNDLPDGDQDGTGSSPEDPRIAELQAQLKRTDEFVKRIIENAQIEQKRLAEAKAKEEEDADYQKRLAQWEEMDPDQARQEQVRYLAEQATKRENALKSEIEQVKQILAQSEQEKAQAADAAATAAARQAVVEYLAKEFKLTPEEVEDMSGYNDPLTMEGFAKRALARRQNQTKAARETRRQELAANPALKGGETGSGTQAATKTPETLDELVDSLFGP